jgi:hypothetical protein
MLDHSASLALVSMKPVFLLCALALTIVAAEKPKVSQCFKVHSMSRADEEHYWTTWTNACPYTIDSVYVMVGFADKARAAVGDGVWGLHFIKPGAHRTMRFSSPGKLTDFNFVDVRKITGDMGEAFFRAATTAPEPAPQATLPAETPAAPQPPAPLITHQQLPPEAIVAPAPSSGPRIIGDPGERPGSLL